MKRAKLSKKKKNHPNAMPCCDAENAQERRGRREAGLAVPSGWNWRSADAALMHTPTPLPPSSLWQYFRKNSLQGKLKINRTGMGNNSFFIFVFGEIIFWNENIKLSLDMTKESRNNLEEGATFLPAEAGVAAIPRKSQKVLGWMLQGHKRNFRSF